MCKVKKFFLKRLPVHLTLIDPEKCNTEEKIIKAIKQLKQIKTDAILVGGSSNLGVHTITNTFKKLKETLKIPLLSFLRDASGVNPLADAAFAPMVLNSRKKWFLSDNFLNCIDNVLENNIELLTLAYLVQPGDTSVSFIVDPHRIYSKESVLRMYARFINRAGFDFAYLEGGSGSKKTISPGVVSGLKKYLTVPLLVGGGIKNPDDADKFLKAGVDGLVTGSLFEKEKIEVIKKIVSKVTTYRK
ncbi:MAG: geranylgeranylglyceryl/heptaprenylglyceryl phosphate synthase [Patescibacteria group bacterium]